MADLPIDAPDGFKPFPDRIPAITFVGPFYYRSGEQGPTVGFRIQHHHTNSNGSIHGGLVMMLADFTLCSVALHGTREGCATISFNSEFIAPAMLGDWVEAHAEILRRTRTLVFARGIVKVADQHILNFSATVRRIQP